MTVCHIYEVRKLTAADRFQDTTGTSWGTHGEEGTRAQYFNATAEGKRKLNRNMCICDNSMEMILKETTFGFTLYSSTVTGAKGEFWTH